jgi:hypothetical protein
MNAEFADILSGEDSIPTKPPDIVNGFVSPPSLGRVSFRDKVLGIQTSPPLRERVHLIDNNLVRIEHDNGNRLLLKIYIDDSIFQEL